MDTSEAEMTQPEIQGIDDVAPSFAELSLPFSEAGPLFDGNVPTQSSDQQLAPLVESCKFILKLE